MMVKFAVTAFAAAETAAGLFVWTVASTPVEVVGGGAIVAGTGVAVWGVVHELLRSDRVSAAYRSMLEDLRADNEVLRDALRNCQERLP